MLYIYFKHFFFCIIISLYAVTVKDSMDKTDKHNITVHTLDSITAQLTIFIRFRHTKRTY